MGECDKRVMLSMAAGTDRHVFWTTICLLSLMFAALSIVVKRRGDARG
jgi:hypothetical protein